MASTKLNKIYCSPEVRIAVRSRIRQLRSIIFMIQKSIDQSESEQIGSVEKLFGSIESNQETIAELEKWLLEMEMITEDD